MSCRVAFTFPMIGWRVRKFFGWSGLCTGTAAGRVSLIIFAACITLAFTR